MRRLHLAFAAVLAVVAGFGKNFVTHRRLGIRRGFIGSGPDPVKGFGEDRGFIHKSSTAGFYLVPWELCFASG